MKKKRETGRLGFGLGSLTDWILLIIRDGPIISILGIGGVEMGWELFFGVLGI